MVSTRALSYWPATLFTDGLLPDQASRSVGRKDRYCPSRCPAVVRNANHERCYPFDKPIRFFGRPADRKGPVHGQSEQINFLQIALRSLTKLYLASAGKQFLNFRGTLVASCQASAAAPLLNPLRLGVRAGHWEAPPPELCRHSPRTSQDGALSPLR